jgi:uncharacterized protein with HEPN domain
MPSNRPAQRFRDIVENIDLIVQFTADMSFDQYLADARTRLAVERCLSIVAEAARKLGTEAETRCPEIPWMDIRALGNRLRQVSQHQAPVDLEDCHRRSGGSTRGVSAAAEAVTTIIPLAWPAA